MINTVNVITTIIGIAVLGAAVYFWYMQLKGNNIAKTKSSTKSETGKEKWCEWIIFGALLLVAFLLRVYQFGEIPGGMNQDGAMAAVDAKALADYATDRYGMFMPVHFTAWGYGQMSVLLSYLMVPFIKLFGLSTVTARLPMLIVSMCGIAAAYFLFKRLFGIRAAQIVLVFLVVNPWHYIQSRWALDCNVFPHMFVLGLLFMVMGIQEKRRWLYLSMVFYALCMYSYGISFYTVPVFLLVICIYMLVKKVIKWKDAGISAGIYALISWPIYATMAINALGGKTIETPFFTIPYFPDSVRSQDILFFAEDKWEQLVTNVKATFSVILTGDTLPWNTIIGYGVIYTCFLIFIIAGIYYTIHLTRKEDDAAKRVGYISLFLFLGIGLLAGFITASVNVNRINIILYPIIFFAALGIFFVYKSRKQLLYVLVPMYLLMSGMFLYSYFTDYAETIRYTFFDGFLESVKDLSASRCQIWCITPDSQYQGSYNVSEILTLFALQIDAKYYQGVENNGLIPYQEKFYYCNASQTQINPEASIGYVINNAELELFSEEDFEIITHDNFSAVIPKKDYTAR